MIMRKVRFFNIKKRCHTFTGQAAQATIQNTNTTKRDILNQKKDLILYYTLCHHRMSHFHESCYIGTFHIIHISIGFSSVFHALLMDIMHYLVEFFVHFFCTPAHMHCVLTHLKT